MKKSFSPYRAPNPPFVMSTPCTVGFNEFLKPDKVIAALAKSNIHPKNSLDFRKSPFSKEVEAWKAGTKSAAKSPTNMSKTTLEQRFGHDEKLLQLVREVVRQELTAQKKRGSHEAVLSEQMRKNPFKQVADLRQDIKSLSIRLETEKEDRVKVIEGLWHCFNQKLEDQAKQSREIHTRQDTDGQVRPFVDQSLSIFSKNLLELTEEVHANRQQQSEALRQLRQEVSAKGAEKNSQMEVVITSIEHLNSLMKDLAQEHGRSKSEFAELIEDLNKQVLSSKQLQSQQQLKSEDSRRQLHTFRESMKAELTVLRKTSLEEMRQHIEKALQNCETDRMNIKSRLKKLETAVKINATSEESLTRSQETFSSRFEAMTQVYNQNFEHLESTQNELAGTVNDALEVIKNLTRTLAELRESTDYSIRSSQSQLANLRNSLVSMTEARLQTELDAIRDSISGFQLESRKHITREKSSQALQPKSLRFFKSDNDIYANCSSDSSLGTQVDKRLPIDEHRLTGETIDTLDPIEKQP